MNDEHIVILDAGPTGNDVVWPPLETLGTVTRYENTLPNELVSRIKDATIALTNKVIISAASIASAPKLKYIGTIATGFNQVDIDAARACGITVCNVPNYSTAAVAQHTFGLILALASGVHFHAVDVRNGQWSKAPYYCFWNQTPIELAGKTLGIVGFGNIGQAVGRLGNAFGMKVVVYVPRPKPAPEYAPFAFVGLDELFAQSDVVSLHCNLTPENTGMVDADKIRIMKKTAIIINCSRGPLIKDADLAEALQQGLIAGAGLDVVEKEPMPDSNPLRTSPNCIITPHIAWATIESRNRLLATVYNNIQMFLQGSPVNVVNVLW